MKFVNKLVLPVLALSLISGSSAFANTNVEKNIKKPSNVRCESWEQFDKMVDFFVDRLVSKDPYINKSMARTYCAIAFEDLMPEPKTWLEKHPAIDAGLFLGSICACWALAVYFMQPTL